MSKSLSRMGQVRNTYVFWVAMVLCAVAAMLLIQGCQTTKAWQDMTPKAKATVMMQTYNEQFDAYQRDAAKPSLTDEDKDELNVRLTMIQAMHYGIATYVTYVNLGQKPSIELEVQIMQMAADLARYLTTQGGGSNGR